MNNKTEFYLCLFGGFLGLHKFYKREYGKGFLYFFTCGLFFIGYFKDLFYIARATFLNIEDTREEKKEQARAQREEILRCERERIDRLEQEGVAYCPRCKSTSVQYVERRKQLSLGRAAVGSLINPLAGAVGAVTSKKYKGKVKCLKCGHEWKV